MRVLAIDSSGLTATVGIVEDTQTIAEYTVNYKKTHSQTLLPMIDEMTRMVDLDLSDLDAIAVAGGPGSFTGLRIGSATAKGLGLALNKPLIHVPTVDALAYNVYGCRTGISGDGKADGTSGRRIDSETEQLWTSGCIPWRWGAGL